MSLLSLQQRLASGAPAEEPPLLDGKAKDALRLVFAPTGSYAAELLAEVRSLQCCMRWITLHTIYMVYGHGLPTGH